ncbi:MAG TPA: hypothetical protein VN841_18410 [Bryobacteraceae bacterium]|nr:hypothetical protein [Bryobacteraceae bacterium]
MHQRESRLNAYKHGLTSQTLILDPEDKPAYDAHCQSYADLYQPVGRPEQLLVQMIADDYWRALRGRALETAQVSRIFDHNATLALHPREEKTLANLALYLQRIERSIRNNTKALQEMQLARAAAAGSKPAQPKPAEPEVQLEQSPKPATRAASASAEFVFSPAPASPDQPSANPKNPPASSPKIMQAA